jgi:hypothetical protein
MALSRTHTAVSWANAPVTARSTPRVCCKADNHPNSKRLNYFDNIRESESFGSNAGRASAGAGLLTANHFPLAGGVAQVVHIAANAGGRVRRQRFVIAATKYTFLGISQLGAGRCMCDGHGPFLL